MFENLSEVRRATTAGPKGTRKAQFQIRIQEAKDTLVFSAEQFAEMNIADNSLSQFVDGTQGVVFLAVMPGNSGTFAKTNARGTKGKKFKRAELISSLRENGYDLKEVGLYKIGEEDGKTLYQITGNGKAVMAGAVGNDIPQAAPVADTVIPATEETPPHISEAEESFEARIGEPIVEVEHDRDVEAEESIEDALAGTQSSAEELEF